MCVTVGKLAVVLEFHHITKAANPISICQNFLTLRVLLTGPKVIHHRVGAQDLMTDLALHSLLEGLHSLEHFQTIDTHYVHLMSISNALLWGKHCLCASNARETCVEVPAHTPQHFQDMAFVVASEQSLKEVLGPSKATHDCSWSTNSALAYSDISLLIVLAPGKKGAKSVKDS